MNDGNKVVSAEWQERFLADLRIAAGVSRTAIKFLPSAVKRFEGLGALDELLTTAGRIAAADARELLKLHIETVPDTPLLDCVSLFKGIGLCRQETVHTNALAWLVDPRQPHGFGSSLFLALIGAAQSDVDVDREAISRLASGFSVKRVVPEFVLSASCRLDLFAEGTYRNGERWVLFLEAKVDARERDQQLGDYETLMRRYASKENAASLRVFLTPDGRFGSSSKAGSDWTRLSFTDLARGFLKAYPELAAKPGGGFLKLYLAGLLEDVCNFACGGSVEDIASNNSPTNIEKILG